jgi:hypothetical protein
MALASLGVLDLSIITDSLIGLLTQSRDLSPLWKGNVPSFTITITGSMPETVRPDGDCQLSLYLYHVSQDAFQRNSPVLGRALPIPDQPLSLNLYYVLTAYAKKNYVQEQQAMSIALRCFHDNPLVRISLPAPVPVPVPLPTPGTDVEDFTKVTGLAGEFCVTMEIESVDKLGFLWQAFSAPFRLSAVYKVSVVFITPYVTQRAPALPVKQVIVAADAADPLIAPQVLNANKGVYTINGRGFVSGSTEVLVDGLPAVNVTVTVAGDAIAFSAPPSSRPGLHAVRILVNAIERPPSWWIEI